MIYIFQLIISISLTIIDYIENKKSDKKLKQEIKEHEYEEIHKKYHSILEAKNSITKEDYNDKSITIVTIALLIILNYIPVFNIFFSILDIAYGRKNSLQELAILKHFKDTGAILTESSINEYKTSEEYKNILNRIEEDNSLGITLKRMFSKNKSESLLETIFKEDKKVMPTIKREPTINAGDIPPKRIPSRKGKGSRIKRY